MAFVNIDDDSQAPDIQIYCIGLMFAAKQPRRSSTVTTHPFSLSP